MTPLLKDADNLLLSLPILACATAGAVGRLMEQHSNPIIKGSGWLGSRISMVTGIISGVPLLVYNFAKTIFAKLLNTMTFNRFETLQNFAHFCGSSFRSRCYLKRSLCHQNRYKSLSNYQSS
jgi:hypothetical protein